MEMFLTPEQNRQLRGSPDYIFERHMHEVKAEHMAFWSNLVGTEEEYAYKSLPLGKIRNKKLRPARAFIPVYINNFSELYFDALDSSEWNNMKGFEKIIGGLFSLRDKFSKISDDRMEDLQNVINEIVDFRIYDRKFKEGYFQVEEMELKKAYIQLFHTARTEFSPIHSNIKQLIKTFPNKKNLESISYQFSKNGYLKKMNEQIKKLEKIREDKLFSYAPR